MCAVMAPGIRELMEGMLKTTSTIREKLKSVDYSDLPDQKKVQDSLLMRLLNQSKALDELVLLAKEVEKLATQTSEVAQKASSRSKMTESELEKAISEIKTAENIRKSVEREKEAKESKQEKEKIGMETKSIAEKAKQLGTEVSEALEEAKKALEEAIKYSEEDQAFEEELKLKLEEARKDIESTEEPIDETNKSISTTETTAEETERISKDMESTLEDVKQKAQETEENAEDAQKHAEVANALIQKSRTASKYVTSKLKEKRAMDEALKVVDEAREYAKEVKRQAKLAAEIATDAGKVAEELGDEESDEIKAQVEALNEAGQKAQLSAEEAQKAGEDVEEAAEILKDKRLQDKPKEAEKPDGEEAEQKKKRKLVKRKSKLMMKNQRKTRKSEDEEKSTEEEEPKDEGEKEPKDEEEKPKEEEDNADVEKPEDKDADAPVVDEGASKVDDGMAEEVSIAMDDVKAKMDIAKEKLEQAMKDSEKTTEIADDAKKVLEKIKILKAAELTASEGKDVAEEAKQVAEETDATAESTSKIVEESGKDTEESRFATNMASNSIQKAVKYSTDLKQSIESLEKAATKLLDYAKRGDMPMDRIRGMQKQLNKDITEIKRDMQKCKAAAREAEDSLEDVQRNDPKSWDINPFPLDDEEDSKLNCLVRGPPGTFDGISVSYKPMNVWAHKAMGENEDVLSAVVCVEPQDIKLSKPALVSIPYAGRARSIHGREVVVKSTKNGKDWKVISTTSIERVFENYKGQMFAEMKVKEFATYVVISRLLRDRHTVDKKGGTLASSGDRRVFVTYPHGCISRPNDISLEVHAFDNNTVNLLKKRREKCELLAASSPIVRITHSPTPKEFKKPITINLPLPPNPAKRDNKDLRPSAFTLSALKSKGVSAAQAVSHHHEAEIAEELETLHVLVRNNNTAWHEMKSVRLSYCKNDVVSFELNSPVHRVVLIRTSAKPDSNSAMVHLANMVEDWIKVKIVSIIVHQHVEDRSHVMVQLSPYSKIDDIEDKMINEGFEGPPDPSPEIEMVEGEQVMVVFDGNLRPTEDKELKLIYNSEKVND
uniref:Axoneme-associated protein mst101(2)-like n=1 Tax=Saccoglossus kowalevskii TaxID=10224 RepID=A0ABM0MCD3_SACKO|nr:PREDICTED: axoneme-associated protein mst101(2)-like [Saccoglossus kowalevskii]